MSGMGNKMFNPEKYIKKESLSFTRFLETDPGTLFRVSSNPAECLPKVARHRKLLYFSVNVVIYGSGKIRMDGIGSFRLKPGTVIVRRPGLEFDIERSPDYLEYALTFAPFFCEYLKRSGFLRLESGVFHIDLNESMLLEMAQLLKLMRPDSGFSPQKLFLRVQNLLVDISFPTAATDERESFRKNIERIIDISKNIPEIPEIAEMMSIGYESFRKKFLDIYGVSPRKYFLVKRFQKAAIEILGGIQIKEVAEKYGYNEVAAFAKQFKKLIGQAPATYRENNMEKF